MNVLPICASCKKNRNDQNYWSSVETYISEITNIDFSHGICPECLEKEYPDIYNKFKKEGKV